MSKKLGYTKLMEEGKLDFSDKDIDPRTFEKSPEFDKDENIEKQIKEAAGNGYPYALAIQQLMEDEIDQAHAILIDQLEKMAKEENKKEVIVPQKKEKISDDGKKDNYLLKSIRRLP